MAEFRFQLLGPVRAWRGETELELGAPQQQAVLAVLLLSRGGHVAMATMLDALWGECPPKSGAGAVRTYVSRLRQILSGGDPDAGLGIEPIGDGYALCGGRVQVDLELFEERVGAALAARREFAAAAELCRAALRQWRGVPLVGVPGPYFEPVRTRMVEMRADAAEIEAAAQVESGDHLAAIANLRTLATSNPLRENLHELLMLALYRAGRQADALEVYERARRILRDELGIEPGPSLKRMQARVLSADDALVPAIAAMSRPVPKGAGAVADGDAWQAPAPEDRAEYVGRTDHADHVGRLRRLDRLEALSRQLLKSGGTDQRTVAARGSRSHVRTPMTGTGAATGGAPVGLLSILQAPTTWLRRGVRPRPSAGLDPSGVPPVATVPPSRCGCNRRGSARSSAASARSRPSDQPSRTPSGRSPCCSSPARAASARARCCAASRRRPRRPDGRSSSWTDTSANGRPPRSRPTRGGRWPGTAPC